MKTTRNPALSRRRLMFAGAAGAAAVAVVAPAVREAASVSSAPATTDTTAQSGGYRVTEHVLRYYKAARV